MNSPIKLKDLAAALDLSISTVARALADSPRIGKGTIERVKAEAQRQGYVVDLAARTMRQGTSSLIGFIAPDLQNDFYATAARAVSMWCQERGLQLVRVGHQRRPGHRAGSTCAISSRAASRASW